MYFFVCMKWLIVSLSTFSYTLPDGTFRDEVGKVLSGTSAAQDLENANNLAKNHRPSRQQGLKVRKLSGKSLASLAG